MSVSEKGHVDSVMTEQRVFPPSADFASRARIKSLAEYESLYARANADLEGFGPPRPASICTGSNPSTRLCNGMSRMRSGSSEARPTPATTVWTHK